MATAAPERGLLGRMFMRKTVAQVQRETETSELKRSLGAANLVFLGIGCIIGAGIFVRTGNAAAWPVRTKMPAPMMQPMPRNTRFHGPRDRFSSLVSVSR